MCEFIQPSPVFSNRFHSDRTLRYTLERLLPPDIFAKASPDLARMGERAVDEIPAWPRRPSAMNHAMCPMTRGDIG